LSYDIIIKNGKLIDGAGNPWYRGDLAIREGKIVKLFSKIDEDADKIIDASGLIVSPGFIDMHSHTDYVQPVFNRVESFIRQGITTCVIGMCGDSFAPVPPDKMDEAREFFSTISPIFGNLNITWNTFAEYLAAIEKIRCTINLVPVVGYNNIRFAGQAFENRPPTSEELEIMKKHVAEAMEAGAFGMSTGLIYAPQVYAKTEELIELAKIVAQYNGIYFSHIRNEANKVVEAIEEVIEIVEKSGCVGGHIAHHKISDIPNWGKSKDTIALMEEANNRGIKITCDQYPYNRGMTHLKDILPSWVHEGGIEKLLERLKNPELKERIKKDAEKGIEGEENFIMENGCDKIFIASVETEKWKDIEGKNISEITENRGYKDSYKIIFEMLLDENAKPMVTLETMCEEDIRRIMTSRYQMIGTDGAGIPNNPNLGKFHPRFYGTYPRILGKYVREEKLLTLENAIRKMTSFPAQTLGLRDRGILKEGTWADIVIFDPNTVIDKATYMDPHQFPEGIFHVIVNGIIVVKNNEQNRKRPGKILRRPS